MGIGLFLAFIGFVDAGFVRRVPDAANSPVPVGMGIGGRLLGWPTLVFVVGLLIAIVLVARKTRGAILISIVVTTVFAVILNAIVDVSAQIAPGQPYNPKGWSLNVPEVPDKILSNPDFGLLGDFSLGGSFAEVGVISALLLIFTLMLADFFDTMGTVVGVAAEGGLLERGRRAARVAAGAAGRLAGRGRGRGGVGVVEHDLHRVGLGGRRRRPHRPGSRGHGRPVPGRPVRVPAHGRRPLRGGVARPGRRRASS